MLENPTVHGSNYALFQDDGILPFVSITPISSRDSQEHRIHGKKENGGIEIIPLGKYVEGEAYELF